MNSLFNLRELPMYEKAEAIKTSEIPYKGYRIVEVWRYSNGTSDWEVYRGDQEEGTREHKRTLDQVRNSIDENL